MGLRKKEQQQRLHSLNTLPAAVQKKRKEKVVLLPRTDIFRPFNSETVSFLPLFGITASKADIVSLPSLTPSAIGARD
jgi:hypothetical protein